MGHGRPLLHRAGEALVRLNGGARKAAVRTYNVGVLGFGFIGKVHALAHANLPFFFAGLPFRTRLTHVCCSRPESAEAARAFLGAERGTCDVREISANPAIEVVHICTPNHLHAEALLDAMAHGKHIYCDKPLTATLAEALEVERALPAYGGTSQMTFQNRFFPSAMRARQLREEGRLGERLQFRVSFLHASNADPETPLRWKLSAAAGGGVIADLGSHALDFASFLAGEVTAVNALTKTAFSERPLAGEPSRRLPVDAEDCMLAMARTAEGAVGTIEATKLATGSEDELRAEVHGTRGALRFNSMDPHHLEFYDGGAPDRPLGGLRGWTRIDCGQRYPAPGGFPAPKVSIGWLRAHVQCLYEFLAAVHAGRPAVPDIAHGVVIQKLMEAVRRSAASGRWERP
jgi:predicted dehydrogenase